MSDILEAYKGKIDETIRKYGETLKGPIGKIQDKATRIALISMEHAKMEEALEKAYNESRLELEFHPKYAFQFC